MTTNRDTDNRLVMDNGDPALMATVMKKAKMGTMMGVVKAAMTGLTAAAAFDITTAAVKAAGTITGIDLPTGENLPPVGSCLSLRVTASGTAASVGSYILSDTGGTPTLPTGGASAGVGIATISNDGKTITFPNTVTAFVVQYLPRAQVDMTADYAPST